MSQSRYIDSFKNPRIANFEWPEPEDSTDLDLFRGILEKGAYVFCNDARDGRQAHSYSVGLYVNFLHPEIVILGVSPELAIDGISSVVGLATSGTLLKAGEQRADIFALGHPVKFITIEKDLEKMEYLDSAAWFYRSLFFKVEPKIHHKFPVLQAVWADKSGFYPDDPRCNETVRRVQALSTPRSC